MAAVTVVGAAIYSARKPSFDRMIRRTGAPPEMVLLGKLQRFTESRGNPRTGLGQPELFPDFAEPRNASRAAQVAESKAAGIGYDRNAAAYSQSPYPREMWVFGSGGPYGMLPSSALAPWRGTEALRRGKVTPYDVFNPWRATVFFVDYAHRLVNRAEFRELPPAHRTLLALKRGMASPGLIGDYNEAKARSRTTRHNTEKAARELGLDLSVLDTPIPLDWPRYPGAAELVP
ncbi:hypothetical protein [Plesiocystis pacifica]|uniref:hypothetical protein n=1 Tax=Plesiocystis pacifica TaxID=191768 RepID=UPI001E5284D2|nr:hypothetical protein [Plesiocystis pacifica]